METIHVTSAFQWGFETTSGRRVVPPTDDELVPVLDENQNPVVNPETGEPAKMPAPGWEPRFEEIELPTIVLADVHTAQSGNGQVYKFACDETTLARVLAFYVQHLDAEGRQVVRQALDATSPVAIPEFQLNREQRRALKLAT